MMMALGVGAWKNVMLLSLLVLVVLVCVACGVAFVFVLLLCLCCCCMLLVLGSWFSVLVGVAPVLGFGFWIFFFVAGSWKFKFASSRQKDGSCKRIFHCFQKEVKEKRKERNGGNEESGRNPSRFYRGICKNIPSIIHNT